MNFEDGRLIGGAMWIVVLITVVIAYVGGALLARRRPPEGLDPGQMMTVQSGLLGLFGLLLAFSFATAAGRFADRRDEVLFEADAIRTAYLRADLLPPPHAGTLQADLKAYVATRIAFYDAGTDERALDAAIAKSEQLQKTIWSAGLAGAREAPATASLILTALNDVINQHATRVDALHRELPVAIVALLLLTAIMAVGSIGFGTGLFGLRHPWDNLAFVIVTIVVLGLTLDLDHPRAGFVRTGQLPMLDLQRTLDETFTSR